MNIKSEPIGQQRTKKVMLSAAKHRAKDQKLPFNLTIEDLSIPESCPVLGLRLLSGPTIRDASPTLDRIIPQLGYTKGNVIVISMLANRIKSNATPDQIIQVGQFYKRLLTTR